MAHPKRVEYIPYLKSILGDAPVIWDKKNNCLETRIRCLEAHLEVDAEHFITIQDDAILADDFNSKAESFISSINEEAFYNFYFKKSQKKELLQDAIARNRNYIKLGRLYNEIGFSIHKKHLNNLTEYCKLRYKQGNTKDWVIQNYVWHNDIDVYFSVPSLVNHRDVPSLLRGRSGKDRMAMWFDGDKMEEGKLIPIKIKDKTKTLGRNFKLVNGKIVPK